MPKDPGYDYTLLQDLDRFPDVATALGHYMAAFGCLEQDLWLFFSVVLSTDYPGAVSLLGHLQSLNTKIEAVENFIPHAKNLKPPAKKSFPDLIAIAKECNGFRNKLAHGVFSVDHNGVLHLTPYLGSTARKSQTKKITAKTIEDRRNLDIARLMTLLDCVKRDVPFPAGILLTPTIVQRSNDAW